MERLATKRRRKRRSRPDRSKVSADELDLASESRPDQAREPRLGPRPGASRRIPDQARHLDRVERESFLRAAAQLDVKGVGATRMEEHIGWPFGRGDAVESGDRWEVGSPESDRHGVMIVIAYQRPHIGALIRSGDQAGRRYTYPTPRTVWISSGLPGSSSIWLRSQWTWTSTVRVSPA